MEPQLTFCAATLCDQNAGDQPGYRQSQHHHLKCHEITGFRRDGLDADNDAKLSNQDAEADAVDSATHRHPDDRYKQDVEQLKLLFLRESKNEKKRRNDSDDLKC